MTILHRLLHAARARFGGPGAAPPAIAPELWCRAATVLALRDRNLAAATARR